MQETLKIRDGHVVEIHYTLTNDAGEVIASSENSTPLPYIQGKKNIVPGLEQKMVGRVIGEKFTAKVTPEEGYGPRQESMVQSVPKESFESSEDIQLGAHFQVQTREGDVIVVRVVNITDTAVILDGNHPLAGTNLNFKIEVVSIREATEEELKKGHLHQGAGCCGGHGECHEDSEASEGSCCSGHESDDEEADGHGHGHGGCCSH